MFKPRHNQGFTLVEMMVAVTLFVVVAFITTSAFTSFAEANRRAQAVRTNVDNLNFAMESIVLKMREGNNYSCVPDNTFPCHEITFLADIGSTVTYKRTSYIDDNNKEIGTIEKEEICPPSGNPDCRSTTLTPIVAPEVNVKRLDFYVNNTGRPLTQIVIEGTIDTRSGSREFNLQTTVSQRP